MKGLIISHNSTAVFRVKVLLLLRAHTGLRLGRTKTLGEDLGAHFAIDSTQITEGIQIYDCQLMVDGFTFSNVILSHFCP